MLSSIETRLIVAVIFELPLERWITTALNHLFPPLPATSRRACSIFDEMLFVPVDSSIHQSVGVTTSGSVAVLFWSPRLTVLVD